MIHALDNVKAGQVTHAVRTTTLNGFSIKEGDIIGLDDKKILAKSASPEETTIKLIARMKEDFHQVITLYYGEDVKQEDAEALCEKIAEQYPDCDAIHSARVCPDTSGPERSFLPRCPAIPQERSRNQNCGNFTERISLWHSRTRSGETVICLSISGISGSGLPEFF